ncbi:MAG: sialate O-acetylesterase [Verrucomicrobiales bacterium]
MKSKAYTHLIPFIVFVAAACLPALVMAEVKLPSVIGSHMVLQQGEPVPIWGLADPGEAVTVVFGAASASAKADTDGKWQVKLPTMKANSKGVKMVVKGSNEIILEDVLVGEVWLCSGQSNMEWTVSRSTNAKQEIAAAKYPLIRHIKVNHRPSAKAESDFNTSGWQVASPSTAGNFTAVGYYFARELLREVKVPVGLIGSNWGGTRIEPWVAPEGFKAVPALKADFADKLSEFPHRNGNRIHHQSALALYNGMIHPLLPYAIKGALWYQGESNNGEGMLYHEKMKALIAGWRSAWNKPQLPFYFVQLAPFNYGGDRKKLPGIWQAQLETLKVPNTGMAVITDITTVGNIHPPNKQDVGKRLSLWALAKNYGKKDIVYSGPIFDKADHAEGKDNITVHFQKLGSKHHGLKTTDGKEPSHFEVAGKDGAWHAAQATIVFGDHLMVKSDKVAAPAYVRFAWDQAAVPNLVNDAGLPASPFTSQK